MPLPRRIPLRLTRPVPRGQAPRHGVLPAGLALLSGYQRLVSSRCASAIVRCMQTWDAITSRRNVRDFADQPIRPEDLDQILEAGRRSPSSQNWQPWDFVVVTDRAQLQDLSRVFYGAHHVAGSAATIAVIAPASDNDFHRAQFDLGQATMSMALAAADLGIGSCHAGVADIELARRVLGLPEDRAWVLLLSLGYPADRPLAPVRRPDRRPFDEVVHRGRW